MILHFSFYYKPVEVKFGKEAVKISGKSQELRDKEGLRIHGMRSQFFRFTTADLYPNEVGGNEGEKMQKSLEAKSLFKFDLPKQFTAD